MKNKDELSEKITQLYVDVEKYIRNEIANKSAECGYLKTLHDDKIREMLRRGHSVAMDRTRTDTPGNSRGDS